MAITKYQISLYTFFLLFFSSCAPNTFYSWNGYDDVLLEYYQNPNERAEYIKSLEEIILKSEDGGNIPPGLYAEYGYVFYEEGAYEQAIIYFEKEHAVWPESRIFMNKMIRNANSQKKQSNKISGKLKQPNDKSL
ncbi:MAG: DUF4810 domain-containing protein [Bacteroidetes bacterium]|nr:DUF4810 domain-containing protein [Bacteroidota bacterium]